MKAGREFIKPLIAYTALCAALLAVSACGGGGGGGSSHPELLVNPLEAQGPAGFTADESGSGDTGYAFLSWEQVDGATGYEIYREEVLVTTIADGARTSYTDRVPAPGTYEYGIQATGDDRARRGRSTARATVQPDVADAPKRFTAEVSGSGSAGDVVLRWNRVTAATGYKIYRDGESLVTITGGARTTYTDRDPGAGTYSYTIAATSATVESPASHPVRAVVPPDAPPTPTGFTATASGSGSAGDVDLSWTRVTGATGYKIYRDGTLIRTIAGGARTTYTDNDPGVGTYSYTIAATNTGGDSARRAEVSATIDPDAPTGLSATPSGTGATGDVVLTWTKSPGATGYKIYRTGTTNPIAIVGDVNTYTDNDPGVGTHFYAIAATNSGGDSVRSAEASATINPDPPPTPTGFTASVSGSGSTGDVNLQWNRVTGATGYKIYRGGRLLETISNGATTSYADNDPGAGTYSYTIAATNAGGDSAQSSPSQTVTIPGPPPLTPTGFTATVSGSGSTGDVDLSWTRVTGATGYKIYRDRTLLTTISNGATTSYTDNDPGVGTYSYRIAATNANGDSAQSSAQTATIPPPPPPTPTGFTARVSGSGSTGDVDLSWTRVTGATGYKIYRDGTLLTTIINGATTSYRDNNPGARTYSYTIAATNAGGDSAQSSPPQTVTISAAPQPASQVVSFTASPNPVSLTPTGTLPPPPASRAIIALTIELDGVARTDLSFDLTGRALGGTQALFCTAIEGGSFGCRNGTTTFTSPIIVRAGSTSGSANVLVAQTSFNTATGAEFFITAPSGISLGSNGSVRLTFQ